MAEQQLNGHVHFRLYLPHYNWLDAVVKADRDLKLYELIAHTGYAVTRGTTHAIVELCRLGLLAKPYHGLYQITEKGRIAHALYSVWMQRRAQQRANRRSAVAFLQQSAEQSASLSI